VFKLGAYPAYKDSGAPWLGKVPTHWEVRKVREVARVINGFPFDAARFSTLRGHPLIRIRDLNKGETSTRYDGPFIDVAKVEPGEVLIGMDGDFNVGTWRGSETALLNQRMCCVRSAEQITERFLAFVLPQPLKEINDITWSTTVKHLASGQVERIAFALPLVSEQAAIVRFLDHFDRRVGRYISAKRRLIALLNEQRQAIIQRAVTRGLDPNVRLKPSGVDWLGNIPEHWEVVRAKYLFREVDEPSPFGEEELLSVSHISGVVPRSSRSITMFMAASYAGHKLCASGDLVINTMWAWMGALGVAHQAGIVSPSYAVYRPSPTRPTISDYVDQLLRTREYVREFTRSSTGIRSSRLRLYPDEFLRTPILRPPVKEQAKIVAQIKQRTADLDPEISRADRLIELTREYRTRLIADVVTGKLDVRDVEVPPDEEEALKNWDEEIEAEAGEEEAATEEEDELAEV
jgi:type I restriction enzyme S subunit